MVYFYVHISFNDIVHLQKNLPSDSFCLLQTEKGTDIYYGIVAESVYHSLLHSVSAETLEQLEYLNEDEFSQVLRENQIVCHIGNHTLVNTLRK